MRRGVHILVIAAALSFVPVSAGGGAIAAREAAGKGAVQKPVTIISDRMQAERDSNLVVFSGNVMAEEDFTMCSDELHVVYGADKAIERITAKGNVRIFQEDKTSTSRDAVYNRAGRTITLTGDPVVRQCTDTVRGEKIVVYLDEDRALVESGKGGRVKAVIMPEKKCSGENPTGKGSVEEARCKRTR